MIILRGPASVSSIADPEMRHLVEQRFAEILAGEPYDYDRHGYTIIVEPGDGVDTLEDETSCRILHNLFDDTCFGHPDFSPSFEALEEHPGCYEMVFILNDDGFGIAIFIPKAAGIDADLLSMCSTYATPELIQP